MYQESIKAFSGTKQVLPLESMFPYFIYLDISRMVYGSLGTTHHLLTRRCCYATPLFEEAPRAPSRSACQGWVQRCMEPWNISFPTFFHQNMVQKKCCEKTRKRCEKPRIDAKCRIPWIMNFRYLQNSKIWMAQPENHRSKHNVGTPFNKMDS